MIGIEYWLLMNLCRRHYKREQKKREYPLNSATLKDTKTYEFLIYTPKKATAKKYEAFIKENFFFPKIKENYYD